MATDFEDELPAGVEFGWYDQPADVDAIASTLPQPTFGETMAGALSVDEIPAEVLGWRLVNHANGNKPFAWGNQFTAPSCVAFGTAHAIVGTTAAEILSGDPDSLLMPAPEVIYGGSRVEVGGGRLRGGGSIGAWAAKFVNLWGWLPQTKILSYDFSTYSVDKCTSYGRSGVPADLEAEAKKHPIGAVTLIRTFDEACVAMAQGYFLAVCSNRGFRMTRDKDGFCTPSGSWAHCMAVKGYRRKGSRPGAWILNSWGAKAHGGPKSHDDMPTNGFWCDADVFERMLGAGDTWAFAGSSGFQLRQPVGG